VLPPNLIDVDIDVTVLAGIAKDVVIGGAANPIVNRTPEKVAKDQKGKLLVDLHR
jgi:hypothetical protein